jgi:hypothetical protein
MADEEVDSCFSFLEFLLRGCHYLKINDSRPLLESQCYFNKGTLNIDLLEEFKQRSDDIIHKNKRVVLFIEYLLQIKTTSNKIEPPHAQKQRKRKSCNDFDAQDPK